MTHSIEKALFQGLEIVKFKPMFPREGFELIKLKHRFNWYTFMRCFGKKGCSILQPPTGYEIETDRLNYYICQNKKDGSIEFYCEGGDTHLYKTKSFTKWNWFTYRCQCIFTSYRETVMIVMFSAWAITLTLYFLSFLFLYPIFGNKPQLFILIHFFFISWLVVIMFLARRSAHLPY